jgi:hypothetical protein
MTDNNNSQRQQIQKRIPVKQARSQNVSFDEEILPPLQKQQIHNTLATNNRKYVYNPPPISEQENKNKSQIQLHMKQLFDPNILTPINFLQSNKRQ